MSGRRQQIDGRWATVLFLTAGFGPAEEADAQVMKVVFDDGEVRYLRKRDAKFNRRQRRKLAAATAAGRKYH